MQLCLHSDARKQGQEELAGLEPQKSPRECVQVALGPHMAEGATRDPAAYHRPHLSALWPAPDVAFMPTEAPVVVGTAAPETRTKGQELGCGEWGWGGGVWGLNKGGRSIRKEGTGTL